MQNRIRIKLDPRRGGVLNIDFLRPCFTLSEWPSEEVEIWSSDDGGTSWAKLSSIDYRASHDPGDNVLHVSLLSDITGITQLAFFGIEGGTIGVGWTHECAGSIQIGWSVEGLTRRDTQVGWSLGTLDGRLAGSGYTIQGVLPRNVPISYKIKCPTVTTALIGFSISNPIDVHIGVGTSIGTVCALSVQAGETILGMREFPSSFFSLDEATIAALAGEAAHRKQKLVTLNGTTPEELD